jgi:hypothetical protein
MSAAVVLGGNVRITRDDPPRPGDLVLLAGVPEGLIDDLPPEDQHALVMAVGTYVVFVGWDEGGRAEVQFEDSERGIHFLYVAAHFVKTVVPALLDPVDSEPVIPQRRDGLRRAELRVNRG